MHKHFGQDEILLIIRGTVLVHLGDQERDLHAGGTGFIPAYTWVRVDNMGTEIASVVGMVSRPDSRITCDANQCRQTKNRYLFRHKRTKSASTKEMSSTGDLETKSPKSEAEIRQPALLSYAAFSSRMAAFTLAARSAGIGSMPCSVRAWSAHFCRTSRSVSPRATKSQSTPTSLHLITLDIRFLLLASTIGRPNSDGWRGRRACCQRPAETTPFLCAPFLGQTS